MATALWEVVVHLEAIVDPTFQTLEIRLPAALSEEEIRDLPTGWQDDHRVTQTIGNRWLRERRTLLLWVPSALVPQSYNVLINPSHDQFSMIQLSNIATHLWDKRIADLVNWKSDIRLK